MACTTKKPFAGNARALVNAIFVAAACMQSVFAQEMKTLEPVEVIGTHIKRTDWETPTPMQVITAEDIRSSGAQAVGDLLGTLPANRSGGVHDLGNDSTFSLGAATVSLRGLGSQATLVLLNGRRIAASPYANPNYGQSIIYNLNAIPLAAIERIEASELTSLMRPLM